MINIFRREHERRRVYVNRYTIHYDVLNNKYYPMYNGLFIKQTEDIYEFFENTQDCIYFDTVLGAKKYLEDFIVY